MRSWTVLHAHPTASIHALLSSYQASASPRSETGKCCILRTSVFQLLEVATLLKWFSQVCGSSTLPLESCSPEKVRGVFFTILINVYGGGVGWIRWFRV